MQITTLPADFGDGWMSNNASDLIRIIVAFTDIEPERLVKTILRIHRGNRRVNTATVEKAIAAVKQEETAKSCQI